MSDKAHDLIPETIAAKIPPLCSTEVKTEAIVWLKWFTPDSSWTWYITEYDPQYRICFGLVEGQEIELGYFSLDEIEKIRGPMGLPVERDLYFEPTPLTEIHQEIERSR
jgi:hypothetical protein